MDKQTRGRALRLPEEKRSNPRVTNSDIGHETGHMQAAAEAALQED